MGVELDGAVALVTGASRGIGRAAALALAEAGCDVVGLARGEADLESLGKEVATAGRSFLPLPADLTEVERLPEVVAAAWGWRGGLDVLVNVAGIIVRTEPPTITPEAWDRTFAVNVRGPYFLTQEVGARMLAGRGGSVVNVASLAGEVVTRAALPYQASKAALIQLTRALAVRWAPRVRVNAVGPGHPDQPERRLAGRPRQPGLCRGPHPLGRVGQVEDVAGAVVFLASPAAAYVTGQHLLIDGGWSAQ